MSDCSHAETLFLDALYNELPSEELALFQQHLDQCSVCADEFTSLRQALTLVDSLDREHSTPSDPWPRLQPELARLERPRFRAWAVIGTVAATFLLTFLLLRTPAVEVLQPAEVTVDRPDPLEAYLRRARPLLLAWSNRDEGHVVSAELRVHERKRAHLLAREAERLRQQLEPQLTRETRGILEDGERLFLQVANLEARQYDAGMKVMQDAVTRKSLLFRISLYQLRGQQKST